MRRFWAAIAVAVLPTAVVLFLVLSWRERLAAVLNTLADRRFDTGW